MEYKSSFLLIRFINSLRNLDLHSPQMEVDKLILQLNGQDFDIAKNVEPNVLAELIRKAKVMFQAQPVFLELSPPLIVCGDIHAQYNDLRRIFSQLGQPPIIKYLFLGDYVDRGPQNLETIALLLCYKVKYPACFYLVRGNHETSPVNSIYGFKVEIERRYGKRDNIGLFWLFNDAFSQMPCSALIGGRILCMHGGLSPTLTERNQLRTIKRGWQDSLSVPIAIDLLWSDPEPGIKGWKPSPRGCSHLFGDDVLEEVCRKLDVDVIVRAHQVVQDGYEIHPTQKLVTVFSAPNYCGEFNNAGAAMHIDVKLGCSFTQFWPVNSPQQNKQQSKATAMPISSRYIASQSTSATANNKPMATSTSNNSVSNKPTFHVKPSAPVKLLASSRYTPSSAVVPSSKSNPLLATSSRYVVSTPPQVSKPQTPTQK